MAAATADDDRLRAPGDRDCFGPGLLGSGPPPARKGRARTGGDLARAAPRARGRPQVGGAGAQERAGRAVRHRCERQGPRRSTAARGAREARATYAGIGVDAWLNLPAAASRTWIRGATSTATRSVPRSCSGTSCSRSATGGARTSRRAWWRRPRPSSIVASTRSTTSTSSCSRASSCCGASSARTTTSPLDRVQPRDRARARHPEAPGGARPGGTVRAFETIYFPAQEEHAARDDPAGSAAPRPDRRSAPSPPAHRSGGSLRRGGRGLPLDQEVAVVGGEVEAVDSAERLDARRVSAPKGVFPSKACSTIPSTRSPSVRSSDPASALRTRSTRRSSRSPVWTRSIVRRSSLPPAPSPNRREGSALRFMFTVLSPRASGGTPLPTRSRPRGLPVGNNVLLYQRIRSITPGVLPGLAGRFPPPGRPARRGAHRSALRSC